MDMCVRELAYDGNLVFLRGPYHRKLGFQEHYSSRQLGEQRQPALLEEEQAFPTRPTAIGLRS
jgi:hypothetical protein